MNTKITETVNYKSKPMKIIFKFIAAIFILLSGCDKEEIVNTINSDILISARTENNYIYIVAETVKEFECVTYSITYSIQKNGNIINIEFLDVLKPVGCYAAFGPARTEINLGELEDDDYTVNFRLDGEETQASLSINPRVNLEITKSGNVKLN